MLRKLAKLTAYKKNPAATFALLHPRRALKWGAMFWLGKKLLGGGKKAKPDQPAPEALRARDGEPRSPAP
ncbi:MAG TPA: hypothetical protein VMK65_04370 [Longimicrobiales bacterium]|nr:hypothetical protein [Longimicrobiales bacterium]